MSGLAAADGLGAGRAGDWRALAGPAVGPRAAGGRSARTRGAPNVPDPSPLPDVSKSFLRGATMRQRPTADPFAFSSGESGGKLRSWLDRLSIPVLGERLVGLVRVGSRRDGRERRRHPGTTGVENVEEPPSCVDSDTET